MKVEEEITECSLLVKDGEKVCSSEPIVDKIRETLTIGSAPKDKVIDEAKEKLKCTTEACVLKKMKNKLPKEEVEKELKYRFKSIGETKPSPLSNLDHDNINYLLALKYPDFHAFPFVTIDFYEYDNEVRDIDFKKYLRNGKKRFSILLNTDNRFGKGKHWICMFIDLSGKKWTIEFFNSSGRNPCENVVKLMVDIEWKLNNIVANNKNLRKSIIVERCVPFNLQHQKKRTECGVYCLYYIMSRLEGVPRKYFGEKRVSDEAMELFRKSKLFRLDE